MEQQEAVSMAFLILLPIHRFQSSRSNNGCFNCTWSFNCIRSISM